MTLKTGVKYWFQIRLTSSAIAVSLNRVHVYVPVVL